MQESRLRFAQSLGKDLRKAGIRAIVTDLDDTWIHTELLFQRVLQTYAETVAQQARLKDPAAFLEHVKKTNIDIYSTHGPTPTRWPHFARVLGEAYSTREKSVITDPANVDIFATIYMTAPRLKRNAHPILQTLFLTGLPFIVNTLSDDDWTDIKLRRTKTRPFFTHVQTVPPTKFHKDEEDWRRATALGGAVPEESAGIGDSRNSDIIPAARAGYKKLVWIPGKWDKHISDNEAPPGTITVRRVTEIIKALKA